ncbi:MAG: PRC-barrel domain-containing protein [Hyphomicrobiaceae bacterium]
MLWNASELVGSTIKATDGEVGIVSDVLFDDQSWMVRWLVVDTGSWLPGRVVLLPLSVLGQPDRVNRLFPVNLTKRQVEDSPDEGAHLPVSRKMEAALFGHYGWEPYWGGDMFPVSNAIAVPYAVPNPPSETARLPADPDCHLRSSVAVTGYHMHTVDGELGQAEDFLIDGTDWRIRDIVVETNSWLPSNLVLTGTSHVKRIDWAEQRIYLDLTIQKIKDSPAYEPVIAMRGIYDTSLVH